MNEQLKHIFDSSACLSKRQLRDYTEGSISREEQYAIEHHVTNCFFCSEAIDGMTKKDEALVAVDELNANFLKDHFSLINPQVHLNSIAPAVATQPIQKHRIKGTVQPLVKPSSIVAALLLGFGILWYLEFGKDNNAALPKLAQQTTSITDKTPDVVAEKAVAAPEQDDLRDNITALLTEQTSQAPANSGNEQKNRQTLLSADIRSDKKEVAADTEATHEVNGTAKKEAPKIALAFTAPPSQNDENAGLPVANSVNTHIEKAVEKTKEEAYDSEATSADALYDAGKYGNALSLYKKQMNAGGNRDQQNAALQAARCYVNLGQKGSAIKLLESLADNGSGAPKRQAKRLLRDIGKDVAE